MRPATGGHNMSVYRIEGSSDALNRFELPFELVRVLKWFDNFWIFIEIKFISKKFLDTRKKNVQINTYISLSIFQGEDTDNKKYQLFRVEWDDFNNPDEKHSQPHWHITSDQAIERTFEEYSNNFDNGDFISLLKEVRRKVFDVKRMHFAMNGNWQNNETDVHKIDDIQKIVKWFKGMLEHLRIELG
ncbi:MAG: hypothetical protein ABI208_09900 [Ginsengibacter sp.]